MTQKQTHKLDFINIKKHCDSKGIIKKLKSNPWNQGHICNSHMIRKWYSEHIKNSYSSTIKQTNNQTLKWTNDLIRHFSKNNTQMADKHMKRCLLS